MISTAAQAKARAAVFRFRTRYVPTDAAVSTRGQTPQFGEILHLPGRCPRL